MSGIIQSEEVQSYISFSYAFLLFITNSKVIKTTPIFSLRLRRNQIPVFLSSLVNQNQIQSSEQLYCLVEGIKLTIAEDFSYIPELFFLKIILFYCHFCQCREQNQTKKNKNFSIRTEINVTNIIRIYEIVQSYKLTLKKEMKGNILELSYVIQYIFTTFQILKAAVKNIDLLFQESTYNLQFKYRYSVRLIYSKRMK